jgi:hypothetical protein
MLTLVHHVPVYTAFVHALTALRASVCVLVYHVLYIYTHAYVYTHTLLLCMHMQEPTGVRYVRFAEQNLGLKFKASASIDKQQQRVAEISGFARSEDGSIRAAEACGKIAVGQVTAATVTL